jgi:hypothetical protein
MGADVYGPLVGRDLIERAVLALLQTPPEGSEAPLIVYYLAEVERQQGLAPQSLPWPPGPSSYRGGVDLQTLMPEWFPLIGCEAQPVGIPERGPKDGFGYGYGQWFEVKLAATAGNDDEDAARLLAAQYGIALALLIVQHGSLGHVVGNTVLTASPNIEYLDPEVRQVARSVITFRSYVDTILTESGPPLVLSPDPYQAPGDWPVVETVDVTLDAIAPGDPLP